MSQRSRQQQLQRLLGEEGEVLPYVDHPHGPYRSPGWYATLAKANGKIKAWTLPNGQIYLGYDAPTAGGTIATLHAP